MNSNPQGAKERVLQHEAGCPCYDPQETDLSQMCGRDCPSCTCSRLPTSGAPVAPPSVEPQKERMEIGDVSGRSFLCTVNGKRYVRWENAGGMDECKHGYARCFACPYCEEANPPVAPEGQDSAEGITIRIRRDLGTEPVLFVDFGPRVHFTTDCANARKLIHAQGFRRMQANLRTAYA